MTKQVLHRFGERAVCPISTRVISSTGWSGAPSIRLDSSRFKALSRASIRSCSTHAVGDASVRHTRRGLMHASELVSVRGYLDVTRARHPNNNRNTATTGIIVGPSSACLTSGLIKRLYGPILTTQPSGEVYPTTRSAQQNNNRRKTGDAKP